MFVAKPSNTTISNIDITLRMLLPIMAKIIWFFSFLCYRPIFTNCYSEFSPFLIEAPFGWVLNTCWETCLCCIDNCCNYICVIGEAWYRYQVILYLNESQFLFRLNLCKIQPVRQSCIKLYQNCQYYCYLFTKCFDESVLVFTECVSLLYNARVNRIAGRLLNFFVAHCKYFVSEGVWRQSGTLQL